MQHDSTQITAAISVPQAAPEGASSAPPALGSKRPRARPWAVRAVRLAGWVALGGHLMACSGADEPDPTHVTSESGALLVTVSSEPEDRPVRGSNRITFYIESASTGEPVDDLELDMTPFMPAHGHGTSQEPSLTPLGDGSYRFDDVLLTMAGLWELRTTVSGPLTDYFAPRFEVE